MSGYKNIIFSIEKKSKSPKKVEEKFFKIDIDYKHEEDAKELNNGNSINEKNKNNKLEDNQTKKNKNTNNNNDNNSSSNVSPIIEEINLSSNNDNDNEKNNSEIPPEINDIILNDEEFASPVVKKKESKLISDFHYVTFSNEFGENTCFINVILHLLNNIPELNEYLISLYQIEETNKNKKNKKSNSDKNQNNNKFLVLLGRILNRYATIIEKENEDNSKNSKNKSKNKKKQVTIIKTLNMRKNLDNISSNKFPLNSIADPIELFTFILDILNENLNGDLHKSFYLELIEEFHCKEKKNCQNVTNKYDKDNFIYHIYINEIIKYIEQKNISIKDFKNKLFEFSYKLFLSENFKICEKCNKEMSHDLICLNCPEFLLINCVWEESNPNFVDVVKFFFLLSLKDELNNLFICSNKKSSKKNHYYLMGFILYSFTLSHYIICIYNPDKNIFVLLDDEIVKEYNNLYELIIDIIANALKKNGKAFFYPVMLIFTKEQLYSNKDIKFNTLNDDDFDNIISKCYESIDEYELQNKIDEEAKLNNYQEYVQMQIEIEKSLKKKEKSKSKKKNNGKEEKIIDIKGDDNEKYIENETNNINNNGNKKTGKDKYKSTNKIIFNVINDAGKENLNGREKDKKNNNKNNKKSKSKNNINTEKKITDFFQKEEKMSLNEDNNECNEKDISKSNLIGKKRQKTNVRKSKKNKSSSYHK